MQSLSYPVQQNDRTYLTIIAKDKIPKQNIMCERLGIKSPKTLRLHLNYLIERGYIQKLDNGDYLLPEMENIYFLIPLKTLEYLRDNCRNHVIKIYVYLGQRYKYASNKN